MNSSHNLNTFSKEWENTLLKANDEFFNESWKVISCNFGNNCTKTDCPFLHPGEPRFCQLAFPENENENKCSLPICSGHHLVEDAHKIWNNQNSRARMMLQSIFLKNTQVIKKIECSIKIISRPRYIYLASFLALQLQSLYNQMNEQSKELLAQFCKKSAENQILDNTIITLISNLTQGSNSQIKQLIGDLKIPSTVPNPNNQRNNYKCRLCRIIKCSNESCSYAHHSSELRCQYFSSQCQLKGCRRIHQDLWVQAVESIKSLLVAKKFQECIQLMEDFLKDKKTLARYSLEIAYFLYDQFGADQGLDTLILQMFKNGIDCSQMEEDPRMGNYFMAYFDDCTQRFYKKYINPVMPQVCNENILDPDLKAKKAFEDSNLKQAIDYFEKDCKNRTVQAYYVAQCLSKLDVKTNLQKIVQLYLSMDIPLGIQCAFEVLSLFGHNSDALFHINTLIKHIPQNSYYYFCRGKIQNILEKHEDSINSFKEVLELDDKESDMINYEIGISLKNKFLSQTPKDINILEEARNAIEKAQKIRSKTDYKLELDSIVNLRNDFFNQIGSVTVSMSEEPQKLSGIEKICLKYKKVSDNLWIQEDGLIDKSNASVYNAIYKCRPAVAKKVDCNISGSNEKDIQRELDILPKIIHPNIVEYLSCLYYQGKANQQETVFIVLEKCVCNLSQIVLKETKDLNEKTITLRNGLTTKKKFDLMEDMLKGLNYIHNEISPPCIHRDLKPQNILITSDFRAKIADFGSSKFTEEIKQDHNMPSGGTKVTQGWVAPEGPTSSKADIFVMGCIFFYLYYDGLHLFGEPERYSFDKYKIQENISKNQSQIDYIKNPEFRNLIMLMTDPDKNQRLNAKDLLGHPFFWSVQDKIDFLRSIKINSTYEERRDIHPLFKRYYENISNEYRDWMATFDFRLLETFGIMNLKKDLFGLIQSFQKIHVQENLFLRDFCRKPLERVSSLLDFFIIRFPKIIIDTYIIFNLGESNGFKSSKVKEMEQEIWYVKDGEIGQLKSQQIVYLL